MTEVLVLSEDEVASVLSLPALLPVLDEAFDKQGRGDVEKPHRPHFPVGIGLDTESDPAGTGISMPAYVHGEAAFATKLVTVHEDNPARDLPTINAQIVLTDAATGIPLSIMGGTHITNARTGCIGGLAVSHLADDPVSLGVFGAGPQARWQIRAIDAAADLKRVHIYTPSDSRERLAAEFRSELDADVLAVDSPEAAVAGATVVVTATTAAEPVFRGETLEPGTLVVAVGAYNEERQELDPTTFERAARVFADTPEEVAEIGDLLATDLGVEDLLHFGDVCGGRGDRGDPDDIVIVESVGTAVLDVATAAHVYEQAEDEDVGTTIDL